MRDDARTLRSCESCLAKAPFQGTLAGLELREAKVGGATYQNQDCFAPLLALLDRCVDDTVALIVEVVEPHETGLGENTLLACTVTRSMVDTENGKPLDREVHDFVGFGIDSAAIPTVYAIKGTLDSSDPTAPIYATVVRYGLLSESSSMLEGLVPSF